MEINMSAEQVLQELKQLNDEGKSLNKKKLKKSHPDLVKNALYYFPSWEHVMQEGGLS